jgi:hypothetical protein
LLAIGRLWNACARVKLLQSVLKDFFSASILKVNADDISSWSDQSSSNVNDLRSESFILSRFVVVAA